MKCISWHIIIKESSISCNSKMFMWAIHNQCVIFHDTATISTDQPNRKPSNSTFPNLFMTNSLKACCSVFQTSVSIVVSQSKPTNLVCGYTAEVLLFCPEQTQGGQVLKDNKYHTWNSKEVLHIPLALVILLLILQWRTSYTFSQRFPTCQMSNKSVSKQDYTSSLVFSPRHFTN